MSSEMTEISPGETSPPPASSLSVQALLNRKSKGEENGGGEAEEEEEEEEVSVVDDNATANAGSHSSHLRVHLPTSMTLTRDGRAVFRTSMAAGGLLLMEEGRVEEVAVEEAAAERAKRELGELRKQRDVRILAQNWTNV